MISSTSLHVTIDLREIPVEFEYDSESGDVTAFNDDLRIMAIGATPGEAETSFHQAFLFWLVEELRAGNPLPEFVRTSIAPPPPPPQPTPRARRGVLAPA